MTRDIVYGRFHRILRDNDQFGRLMDTIPAVMPLPPVPLTRIDAGFGPYHELLVHGGGWVERDACLAQQHEALVERVQDGLLEHIPHCLCGGMLTPSCVHAHLGLRNRIGL